MPDGDPRPGQTMSTGISVATVRADGDPRPGHTMSTGISVATVHALERIASNVPATPRKRHGIPAVTRSLLATQHHVVARSAIAFNGCKDLHIMFEPDTGMILRSKQMCVMSRHR